MTNSVDPDQTAQSVLGPHCLLLYLNLSLIFGNNLQQTTSADRIFRIFFASVLRVKIQTYPISMSFIKSCFAKYAI